MWVVRADDIASWTRETIAEGVKALGSQPSAVCRFALFRKTTHKRSMTFVDYVGEIEADSPESALGQAVEKFADTEALAWWVIRLEAIYKSDPDSQTIESWFAPAKEKTYKQQSYYATVGSHASKYNPRAAREDEDEG